MPSVLWKGRILQFKGQFSGDQGAAVYLHLARPPDRELESMGDKLAEELAAMQQHAQRLESAVRAGVEGAEEQRDQFGVLLEAQQRRVAQFDQPGGELEIRRRAKADATYWLGQLALQRKDYKTAARYFRRIVDAAPDGRWAPGARYQLGRALEAQGQLQAAIDVYEAETSPQQRDANVFRARRLQQQLAESGQDAS